jgi:hypothetical protein
MNFQKLFHKKSTDFIAFQLNPIWGTSEIFETTQHTTTTMNFNEFQPTFIVVVARGTQNIPMNQSATL